MHDKQSILNDKKKLGDTNNPNRGDGKATKIWNRGLRERELEAEIKLKPGKNR